MRLRLVYKIQVSHYSRICKYFWYTYHLLKEMATWRAGCNRDSDFVRELFRLLCCYQESVDCGGRVEMSNALLFQELPDEWVVNLSQADIQAAHRHNRPRKSPPNGVKPGKEIIVNKMDSMTVASAASGFTYMGRVHRYLQRP